MFRAHPARSRRDERDGADPTDDHPSRVRAGAGAFYKAQSVWRPCQSKRSALFAAKLREEIIAPVPHRQFVLTVREALHGLFRRELELPGLLARRAFETVKKSLQ